MKKEETRKMYNATPYSLKEAHSILHNLGVEHYAIIFSCLPPDMEKKRVLDAGCGGGDLLVRLLHLNMNAVGLDLSLGSLKSVRKMLKEHDWSTPTLVNADVENIPFRDGTFDMVTSWGVLHHTEDSEKGLRELVRASKEGGVLFLMLYHRHSFWNYLKIVLRFLCNHANVVAHILRLLPPFWDETIYNDNFANPIAKSYTQEEVNKMCEDSGLKIEKLEISGLPLISVLPRKLKRPLTRLLQTYASRYGWCITIKSRCLKRLHAFVKRLDRG